MGFEEAQGLVGGLGSVPMGSKAKTKVEVGVGVGGGHDGAEVGESVEDVEAAPKSTALILTPEDFLLGIFDSVGEIMRWAITNLALSHSAASPSDSKQDSSSSNTTQQKIVHDLRALRVQLEGLKFGGSGVEGDARGKMDVMRACVEKVEVAVYGVSVRGSERPVGGGVDV